MFLIFYEITKKLLVVYILRYMCKRVMQANLNEPCKLETFVTNCRKILGVGLNYMDIIKYRNLNVPQQPILFMKPSTSLIQEGQDIIVPKILHNIAHEVELGFVISKRCKNVSKAAAMRFVGGYCLALDMTGQSFLVEARSAGMPWTLGKGFDTSTPVSRLISPDEIGDPHCIPIWLKVNDEFKQKSNTMNMIFKIPDIIEYASKFMTLEPYDIILTGTPGGANPVAPGDTIVCGLGDLVEMTFKVREE